MDAPSVQGDKVYFNAGFTGIDNIFYTDLMGSKKIFQVTSVPIGAFDPKPTAKNEILFTEYTEMGYVISKQSVKAITEVSPYKIEEPATMPIYQTTANAAEGGNILNKPYTTQYKSKSYPSR